MQDKLNSSILKTLAYFDLFHHPLCAEEIQIFLDQKTNLLQLSAVLDRLTTHQLIYHHDQYYSLCDDPMLAEQRKLKNEQARPLLLLAKKISRFLFRFPFVRGIGISGSLSKNCADQDSDIDFFVITRRNRLWICRTLMHLFKKLTFLTGHQHWFCMNYYIDEVALCIEEKNLFTATELVTLLPVCGKGVMESFYQANSWVQSYFPNRSEKEASSKTTGQHRFKNAVEFLFSNPAGEKLDNFLMKLTSRRWKKKEDQFRLNIKGKRMGLRTGKHFSKPNPVFFQEKILSLHSKRLREMEEKLQATPAANENQVLFLREII